MEKNQNFFDPYNFSMQQNIQNTNQTKPIDNFEAIEKPLSPSLYYEQQYMYYKYLNEMLSYKIKLKELERLNKNCNMSNNNTK